MIKQQNRRIRVILLVLGIAIILCALFQVASVSAYNNRVHISEGHAESDPVYMDIHPRGDSTAEWFKDTIGIYGKVFDGTLYNNSANEVRSWNLRINVEGECYINQFWNGEVEIHQNVALGTERVQLLNLADYHLEDLEVEYRMDGADLLIPLHDGDYVIYQPSHKFNEVPLKAHDRVVIGVIFYNKMPYSVEDDYVLEYHLHKSFTQGGIFVLLILLIVAWLMVLILYHFSIYVYRKAEKEMELRKSGISCMTELYAVIYIIDLVENTITPVGMDEELDRHRPKHLTTNEQLQNLFRVDAEDEYRDLMLEFAELSTIPERMENRNSLTIEYISKSYGWCSIRFIAMDREPGKPLKKVLFTIQQINEEKKELDKILGQVEEARSESLAQSTFLNNISTEVQAPIRRIMQLNDQILEGTKEPETQLHATEIHSAGNDLFALINSILDYSRLEAGRMVLNPRAYSLRKMVLENRIIARERAEGKNLEIKFDVTQTLPDQLYGDDERLGQVILTLLTNAVRDTEEGVIYVGIFGKKIDEKVVHLLISVKNTGHILRTHSLKAEMSKAEETMDTTVHLQEGEMIGLNLIRGLLRLMNSELKEVEMFGKGGDFYFEVEQQVLDPAPIGPLDEVKAKE